TARTPPEDRGPRIMAQGMTAQRMRAAGPDHYERVRLVWPRGQAEMDVMARCDHLITVCSFTVGRTTAPPDRYATNRWCARDRTAGEPAAPEPGHRGGTEPRDDDQVRPPDAGHQLAVAAETAALGPGVRRRLPRQPAAHLHPRRRAGDVRSEEHTSELQSR